VSKWHLNPISVSTPKKTVKQVLMEIAISVLNATNAPKEIDLVIYKYNIINKLQEEINKLDEETAEKVLTEIRRLANE